MIDIQNYRTVDSWLLDQMGITWRVELGLAGLGLGLREWWSYEDKQRDLDEVALCLQVLIFPLSFCQEAKKKYDKETEKYCGILEKHLNLSSKKKESQLQEVRDL